MEMEINLLPARSFFDKYRVLLITVPALLLISLAILFFVNMMRLDADLATQRGKLASITSENVSLQAERTMDAKTKLFHQIEQAVRDVQDSEHAPGPILDGIKAKLPDPMRVTTITMNADSQQVTLSLEADSIDHIASYAEKLRAESWAKEVVVQDIEQTKDNTVSQEEQGSYKSQVIITLVNSGRPAAKSSK